MRVHEKLGEDLSSPLINNKDCFSDNLLTLLSFNQLLAIIILDISFLLADLPTVNDQLVIAVSAFKGYALSFPSVISISTALFACIFKSPEADDVAVS